MGKNTGKRNKALNQQRHDFLLTFFDEKDGNTHKEVNGFILEKVFSGNLKKWYVAIYTKKSWAEREQYTESYPDLSWIT